MADRTTVRTGLICTTLSACLGGCAHVPAVDWSHPSSNQDSRVQFIVIHATEIDFRASLRVLTHGDVSSHYLVDRDGRIYGLVPESRRAWHAGASYWEGNTPLNPSSVGIEIVSVPPGMPEGTETPFPSVQIRAVRALVADIARRHGVRPDRIVGHGEIQPAGRSDPGRLFPWDRLAEDGLVPVPEPRTVDRFRRAYAERQPDVRWYQQHLAALGYRIECTGIDDGQTRAVARVFQGRYRQADVTGALDVETAAILGALTEPGGRVILDSQGRSHPFSAESPWVSRCTDADAIR